jgi:uncharacterized membrane protein HdeD (DUF308 family)
MDLHTSSERTNPRYLECMRLSHCWAWFLILGIALVVVGTVAIVASFIAGLATVLFFGFMLLAGGVVQIVNAFLARSWRGFALHLLLGILHLVVGGLMIEKPDRVLEVLTIMLAVAFVIAGTARILYALIDRFAGWEWVLLNGAIALLLGILIWRGWPESSTWVIGTFVGIDLIFNGWSWVMLGLLVKNAGRAARQLGAGVPGPTSAAVS